MVLDSILLKTFRNYPELKLNFQPGFNFICGPNGAGKSNIIEAVSVLSGLKSFRGAADSDMFMRGTDSYYCAGEVSRSDYSSFEVGCSGGRIPVRRKMKIDETEVPTVYEYYGKLLSVAFSPGDINLINGTAELRRRYFDSVISKFNPVYLESLREYRKILGLRNALLKSTREESVPDNRQLEVWDFMLSEKGSFIINERYRFTERLRKIFQDNYKKIIEPEGLPDIKYRNSTECEDPAVYIKKLRSRLKKDTIMGYTGIGPHRDDYLLKDFSGSLFTAAASQGQKRAAAIALKLSEMEIVEGATGKVCLLLIDDIFPEFDEGRRHNLFSLFDVKRQSFFTMADENIIDPLKKPDNIILKVSENGSVNEV